MKLTQQNFLQILIFLMVILSVLLFWAGSQFSAARMEIAKCNAIVIEHCLGMECEIGGFGKLNCKTTGPVTEWVTENPEIVTLNISMVNKEIGSDG